MQIHELNNKKQQVNEVDLVGPNSVFNVGKQVLKNPKAFVNSSALGAAQQAASQSSAASTANALVKQGYTVGGSAKAQTTPQQQLAQVKSNPAVQQMVKNLASQWKPQGVALAAKIKQANQSTSGTPTTESIRISNLNTNDPEEQKLLYAIQKQELDNQISKLKGDISKTQEKIKADEKILADLNAYSAGFQTWAATRLSNVGVNMARVESDPWAKVELEKLLMSIASWGLINANRPELISDIEEYFNIAVATNQIQQAGNTRTTTAPAGAGNTQQTDQEIISQSGAPLTAAQIEALGTAMRQSAKGGTVIRNTGNELLNAIARVAGFKVAET